jgi:regulator of sirC expression with transglutaminase-like and TPR domain
VRVRLEDESGAAGLVFAADGAERHYGFYPTAGALRLTRFDGPTRDSWTILEQASSPYYRPGDWNDLKVRREKERILCYVNGHLVFESTDSRLPERQVGLAKFRDTRAWFKNFQVGTNLALPSLAPSAEVVAAIEKQLQKLTNTPAGEIVDALRSQAEASQALISARAAKLENEAAQLRRLAVALHEQTVLAELSKALEAPEPQIDLFHAALLISKIDNPELDVASYRRQFDDLARDLVSRLPAKASAADRLAGLTNFFFGESGFHGSRADYDNRANSYLDQVLDDREGLPITLSVLFLELGRRIGLTNLAGVSLPSHFLVRVTTDKGGAQLLDVFDAGRLITRAEAGKVARAHTGEPLRDDQLEAASNREIIIRMVRNLLNLANRTGSNSDSLRYVDAIVALAPESALDRLARASLRLQAGDTAGAKADFQWLFDRKPPGLDLEHVRKLYQALF